MKLKHCHNFHDFRKLAKKKIPSPVFHYIDGAADDEMTHIRNTKAFDDVDLVPNVLRDVSKIDLSIRVEEIFFAPHNKLNSDFKLLSLALNSLESAK